VEGTGLNLHKPNTHATTTIIIINPCHTVSFVQNTLVPMRVTGGPPENGFQYRERHQWATRLRC
jgi:hypothetical protein